MDPDVDTALPVPGSRLDADSKEKLSTSFVETLKDVLEKGGFEEVSEEQLQVSPGRVRCTKLACEMKCTRFRMYFRFGLGKGCVAPVVGWDWCP